MGRYPESTYKALGLGPAAGTIRDRLRDRNVALRTPALYVARYGRGYAAAPNGLDVATVRKSGTQYGAPRASGPHGGEDVYVPPCTPIYAPFPGIIEAVYTASRRGEEGAWLDYGEIVVLRHRDDGRIKTRLVHLEPPLPQVGQYVQQGDLLGKTYGAKRFPLGDPSHIHVEAMVYDEAGAGMTNDRGNRQPFSVFNVELLTKRTREKRTGSIMWPTLIAGVAAAGGYFLLKWGRT